MLHQRIVRRHIILIHLIRLLIACSIQQVIEAKGMFIIQGILQIHPRHRQRALIMTP